VVGTIGGGKAKPTGLIDIAVMQSLSRQGEVHPLVENYGQVIVDECHHVGAVSFDAILKRTKAKCVLGLTATPIRRDGQESSGDPAARQGYAMRRASAFGMANLVQPQIRHGGGEGDVIGESIQGATGHQSCTVRDGRCKCPPENQSCHAGND
jgi:hypothetical protein